MLERFDRSLARSPEGSPEHDAGHPGAHRDRARPLWWRDAFAPGRREQEQRDHDTRLPHGRHGRSRRECQGEEDQPVGGDDAEPGRRRPPIE
jgi:hypothetical protein